MKPEDNSLESGSEASQYNSSLEGGYQTSNAPNIPIKSPRISISLFKFNKLAILITVSTLLFIGLLGGGAFIYDKTHSKASSLNSLEASGTYKNGSTLAVNQAQQADLLTLGQVNQLAINGQLTVNKTIVLTPSNTPTSPIVGEIYYNQTTKGPYYYNGSQFVSLQAPTQYVANVGGVAGSIALGNGLTANGNTLNISASLLQSIQSAAVSTAVVSSVQGQTGNVVLTSGQGILINNSTISNTGVISLESTNNSLNITNAGSGIYNLELAAGSGVFLGPGAAQIDTSNNPSIFINKTGTGNLLELQNGGANQFVVNQSGGLSINGSFTQNGTGTFSTGSGAVSINGPITITGGNSFGVTTGATTLGGTLGVTGASTLGSLNASSFNDSGAARVTGNTSLTGTLSVQGAVTLGNNSPATQGSLIFDNGTNNNAISIVPSVPTGSGGVSVEFPALTGGSTDTFCVTGPDANCGTSATTVTTSSNGTNGDIAEFTGTNQIANSPITDNGSNTLTIQSGYTLNVGTLASTGDLNITPSGKVNINDTAQEVEIQGNASSYFSVSANGKTNKLAFASPTSGQPTNYTITIPDEAGTICLDNDAANCGFATSGSGVTDVNGYTGVICIQDANDNGSCSGNNVTINNATSSALGVASFSSTDFNVLSGAVTTVQNISTSGDVQFDGLSLGGSYNCTTPETGSLCLSTGGTVYTSNIVNPSSTAPLEVTSANSIFQFDQEGTTFEFPTGYGNTTHDICVSGVSCATGTGAAVILQPSSAQADDGSIAGIFINDVNSNCTLGTNCKDLIDLQNGSSNVFTIDQYGNAQFDQTLYADTIYPISGAGGITVGTSGTSQSFTLQGNSGSEVEITNPNGGVSYIGIQNPSGGTASSQSVYYALDDTQAPSSGTNGGNTAANPIFICTSANSYCTASSGITGTGTTGDLPLFNGAHSLTNSILSQSASNIAIAGSSSTSSLTIGNISSTAGQLVFNNGINSNSITFTQPASQPSSAINVGLPSVAGTIAVKGTGPISVDNTGTISCSNCAVTGSGGTGANVVTTLNGLDNAVSITDSLNNAFSTSGQNVQIANASTSNLGLVKINNDGNLTVSSGVIDTAQNIQTSSSPQFASVYLGSAGPSGNDGQLVFYDGSTGYKLTLNQLTLTNNQTIHIPNNSGTLIVAVGSSNNLTLNNGVVDTANAVDFPTSVTTAELLSGSSSLQIGSTSSVQPFTLNGTAGTSGSYSSLDLYSGTYNTKINFASPATGNNVYTFPDAGGISATVCLQNTGSDYNSCTSASGLGGTGNSDQVAYFSGTGTLSSGTNFYDNGSTVGLGGISSGFGTHTQLTVNTNATAINNAVTQLNSGTSNPTYIPLVVEGASTQSADLLDIDSNLGSALAGFNNTGNLYFGGSSNNTITGANNENLTLQSQGTGQLLLNSAGSSLALQVGGTTEATVSSVGNFNLPNGSYQLGGSTTLSSAALTFTASTDSITGPSGSSITLDTTGSGTLYLGNTNAPNIYLGNSNSTTTVAGQLSQSYSSPSASTADTISFTNSNSAAGVAIQGISLTPANTTPSSGTNTLNVLNFVAGSGTNATAITNGINFASSTGYSNFISAPNFVVGSNGVITLGTVGTTEGELTLNSSHSGGSFSIEPSVNQTNSTILYLPTDSSSTDTVCIVSNCTGASAGSGDSSYIYNTYSSQQSPGNIYIKSAAGYVAASIQGASGQDIMDLYSNGGSLVAHFDSSGNLSAGTINGATITSTAFDGASLSGGSLSGSSLSATQLLFSGTSGTVTTNSGDNLTIDTGGGTSTLNLGNAYATTIQIGNTTLSSGTQTINIGNNNTSGGTTNVNIGNGSTALGTVAIQGGNITLTTAGSGTTTISNTYNSTGTGTALKDNVSDIQGGSSGSSTVNADTIGLTGNTTSGETINLNGINFANVSPIANNTFNGLYFGTGYNNAIQGVGSLNITGGGASTWDIGAYTLSLQTLSNGAITTGAGLLTSGGNVALSAAAPSIYSSTANSGLTLQANGTGTLTLNSSGTTGTIGAIQIGNASTASVTQSIYIGNNAGASSVSAVTVGSLLGASALTLQAGSGNLALTTGSTSGNITLTTNNASSSIIAKSSTNSTTAFQVQNSSSTVLTVDTINERLEVDVTYTQLSAPASLSAGNPSSGGNLTASTTYYYEVTAIDSLGGQTTVSNQAYNSTQTSSSNKTIGIGWTAVTGASGYDVYRCSGTSSCTEYYLTAVLTNSFTDSGQFTASTTVTPPTTNTAYLSTNNSNNNGQLTIGGNGTPTGQLYVSGTVPTSVLGINSTNQSIPLSVFVSGHYAYIAENNGQELQIEDISNPADPTYISEVSLGSYPTSVYVQGHYAYLSLSSSPGFEVVDVSNLTTPVIVGQISTNLSNAKSVYVSGNYAYVASWGNSEMVIFNISNPASPTYVASTSSSLDEPDSIYVQGRYAYVMSYISDGLTIFDISNPSSPVYRGNLYVDNYFGTSVFVSGSYAYMTGTGNGDLVIDNISNPSSPVNVAVTNAGGLIDGSNDVYTQGRYAYITSGSNSTNSNLVVYDISNPLRPIYIGEVAANLDDPQGIFVSGRYAYVANDGISTFDTFDLGGTYDQQLQAGGAELGTLQVDGNSITGGDASIQGGLSVGGNAQIQGGLSVSGNEGLNVLGSSTVGNLTVTGLATPAAPTETVTCSGTCLTSYSYAVAAVNTSGVTAASTSTSTGAIANASLNTTTEYNETAWTAVTGAVSYNIYRTVGGGSQGLIGTVPASAAAAPSYIAGSSSETGTTLTLAYSTPPPFVVGQAITLSGFNMTTGTVNGTWPILSVTSSAITINVTSGQTSTIVTSGSATGILGFYDTAQGAGASAPTVNTAGILIDNGPALFENASNSTTAFQIQNASGVSALTTNTTNMRVGIDNSYTLLSAPTGLAVGTATTGGSLTASTTYYYKVTAIDSLGGQTTPSTVASGTTGTTTLTLPVTWTAVTGASGYDVYRCSGTSCTEYYLTAVLTNSFTDSGQFTASTTVTPPTTNTAYLSTNNSNNNGQLTIGGNGTPTGQLYVSGTVPTTFTGSTNNNINNPISTFVSGRYAYIISNGSSELVIDDVSNPADPTYISEIGTNLSGGRYVYVSGHYAYVVCGATTGELVIFDISNPFSPAYVSEITTDLNSPNSVYIQGNYAYIVGGTNGSNSSFVIFNISNPANPIYVSGISANMNTPKTVYVQGSYAYITNYGSGYLLIENISNPANPTYVAETSSNLSGPWGLFVVGRYAYITNSTGMNLTIYDISNPANPTYVAETGTNMDYPVSVYVSGRYAYVASNENNDMVVDDISNPINPINVGYTSSNLDYPSGIFVSGRYAYVASSANNSLVIFDLGGTYDQQLQAGGAELGTLQVDGNSIMSGDASIQGGLAVGSNAQIQGGLSVAGSSSLGNLSIGGLATPAAPTETVTCSGTCATSYSYAVAAINVSGVTAASASTSTGATANASLNTTTEYNKTSWTAVTGATGYNIYRTAGGAAQGLIGTVPASSTTALTATSSYTWSSTALTLNFSTPPPFVVGQAVTLSGFTSTFGSGINATWPVTTVTSSSIIVNVTGSSSNTISVFGTVTGILGFYDTAQTAGSSAPTTTTAGSLTVNGPVLFENASNSTTAFQVQNASGYTLLGVDTTSADNDVIIGQSSNLTGNLIFANASNSYTFSLTASTAATGNISLILPSVAPSSGQCLTATSSTQLAFGGCSTSHTKQITVTAEYAGAVLDSAGDSSCSSANVGTMISGYNDTDSSPQTYYQWSTTQSSAQCYDVVVQVPIPSDWSSWTGTPTIYASAGTGGSIAVAAIASNGTEESNYGTLSGGVAVYHSETTTGSLASVTLQGLTSASDSANGVLTLKIRMSATSSGNTEIGTIIIPYISAY